MNKSILTIFLSGISLFLTAQPTFTGDVAQIIYDHCSTCHRAGEIGAEYFTPLTNYEEISSNLGMIKFVTSNRIMPPWQADPSYSRFIEENFLSEEEIQTIANWVDAGAPYGNANEEPPFPDFPSGSLLGDPDLVVEMTQSHTHLGNNRDSYMYFVLPTGLTEDKIVKAVEFRAGNRKIVHHALIFEDTEGVAANSDAQTPEYGFPGFGGFDNGDQLELLDQKQYPGYVPGQKPIWYPDGLGQTLHEGADIVIQVHYAPWTTAETDRSAVNIFFADNEETVDRFVQDRIMLPFDLPPFGVGGFFSFVMQPEQVKTFHGQWTIPNGLSFIGLSPHMHLLGEDWEVYIEHTDGSTVPLISIPEWDFNWQGNYYFPKFIVAEAGSIVHAIATYDNTSENPDNPSNPPVTVTWGEGTNDEMYYLPLLYVDYREGDENVVFDPTVGLEDLGIKERDFKVNPIFPNPVNDHVNVTFSLKHGMPINVDIVDVNGTVVRKMRQGEFFNSGEQAIHFRSSDLVPGIYFLNMYGNGFSISEKFVKQ